MRGLNIATTVSAIALTGCSPAAVQVLGDGAIVVDPASGQRLTAPGVYRVQSDGTYVAYCKEDFAKNSALKAISTMKKESPDTVVDQVAGEQAKLSFPGLPTISRPYRKTKVEGYTVTRATAPGDGTFSDYVRSGVAAKCRKLLESGDYVIIEQEARAIKSYKIWKGPVTGDIAVGAATVTGLGKEVSTPTPDDATFGVIGTKSNDVENYSASTAHN